MLCTVIILAAVVVLVSTDTADEAPPKRGTSEDAERKMRAG
jgi:hypothetical protein